MSPIAAAKVMAVIGPIPGRACGPWTRGSGMARATRSRSCRATSGLIASIRPGSRSRRPLHHRQRKLSQQDPPCGTRQRLLDADATVGQDGVDPRFSAVATRTSGSVDPG